MSEAVYVDVLVVWEDGGEESVSALMPGVPRIGDFLRVAAYSAPCEVSEVTWEPKSAGLPNWKWRVVVRIEP